MIVITLVNITVALTVDITITDRDSKENVSLLPTALVHPADSSKY